MGKLATDETLYRVLEGITGAEQERTAKVVNIDFDPTMFESGGINNTTGQNLNESGYYRTIGYIEIPANKWQIQLCADRPWVVIIYYYNENKEFQERDSAKTGCCNIKDYPYCRLKFYQQTNYLDVDEFIANRLKIQYISDAPAENEYFLHNRLFNGNFEYDRNDDGVADGWELRNSPTANLVSDKTQFVTPSATGAFLRTESDNRLTGHQIYVAYSAYTPYDNCSMTIYGTVTAIAQNTKYTRSSKIVTAVNSDLNPTIICASGAVAHEIGIRDVMLIDLTEIYGSGNEPSITQVEEIIDKMYGGYVPCDYVVKYDDTGLPVDILTRLKNIDTSSDRLTIEHGEVTSIGHYVGDVLKSMTTITRDKFGNLISVEEVQS